MDVVRMVRTWISMCRYGQTLRIHRPCCHSVQTVSVPRADGSWRNWHAPPCNATNTSWTHVSYTLKTASTKSISIKCRADWVNVLRPTQQNRSFQRRSSQPISWHSTKKPKQTQQKHTCIRNKIYYNVKWTSSTSYDLWPEKGTSLFWKE